MSYISENTNSNNRTNNQVSNGSSSGSSNATTIRTVPISLTQPKPGEVMMFNGIEYVAKNIDGGYF